MQIVNFSQSNQDPALPSGPAELGGIPVHVFLDRSRDPARITIRSSMADAAPLAPRLQSVTAISVAGTSVPVRVAPLKCGATALQGRLDPALVEALAGPLPESAGQPGLDPAGGSPPNPNQEPAPRPEAPAPGGTAPPAPGADPGSPEALLAQYRSAKARLADAAPQSRAARERIAAAERELEAARGELAGIESGASAARTEAADLGARLREAVEREIG